MQLVKSTGQVFERKLTEPTSVAAPMGNPAVGAAIGRPLTLAMRTRSRPPSRRGI